MPFSGYLVSKGELNLWGVGVAGAVGCVLGSLVAYWAGMYGGRPFIEKYGRYILLSRHDLDLADRWFAKYGEWIVFTARLLPAIRTFIAFPAGVARMNLTRFVIYTFAGSLPWCLGLAYVGQKLGEQWDKDDTLKTWFHRRDNFNTRLFRRRSFDGHRVGVHTAAVGDHHAFFRLSRFDGRAESLGRRSGGRGWLCVGFARGLLGWNVWWSTLYREVRAQHFIVSTRSGHR